MKYIFFLWERGLDIQKVEPKEVLIATTVGGKYRLLFKYPSLIKKGTGLSLTGV
jgi:hypothetical protein